MRYYENKTKFMKEIKGKPEHLLSAGNNWCSNEPDCVTSRISFGEVVALDGGW